MSQIKSLDGYGLFSEEMWIQKPQEETENNDGENAGDGTLSSDDVLPDQTWDIQYDALDPSDYLTSLIVKPEVVGQDHLIQFAIWPQGTFPPSRKARWIMKEKQHESSFTVILEGSIRKPGLYVIQLNESWSSPLMSSNPTKTELADSWYSVSIKDGTSLGEFKGISQEEAVKIQGIET